MKAYHGFSLTEVLISLFLVTSISFGLIIQQLRVSQLLHAVNLRNQAWVILNNNAERYYLGMPIVYPDSPFHLDLAKQPTAVVMDISWPLIASHKYNHEQLELTS